MRIRWPLTVLTGVVAIAIGYAVFVLQVNRGMFNHALHGAQEVTWYGAMALVFLSTATLWVRSYFVCDQVQCSYLWDRVRRVRLARDEVERPTGD